MTTFDNNLTAGALRDILKGLPADTPIVICHPDHDYWPEVEVAVDMNDHDPESLPVVYVMPEPHGGT